MDLSRDHGVLYDYFLTHNTESKGTTVCINS